MPAFRLLGPLEIRDSADLLVVPLRPKQQALLALLLLRAGTVVGTDEIIDALWGERPPASARANLYSYVSTLRHTLSRAVPTAEPRPRSVSNGYRLDVRPDECDVLIFEELATAGQRALAEGHLAVAAEQLARGLGLWRGSALEGLEPYEWLLPPRARLEEARLVALEDHIQARLLLGQHADLAVELAATTKQYPLRERMWGQFMMALHRVGRTAGALQAYNELTDVMHEELGAGPGPSLRALHRQIRADDPALRPGPAEAIGGSPSAADAPVALDQAAVTPAPALLPPGIPDFTGRQEQAEHLRRLLSGAAGGIPTALVVAGVGGMAGIGKTTLIVHVAHRVAPSYPDGQLYINLRGEEPSPVPAAEALARFLRAMGVDSRAIPPDPAARTELYRTRLAGRRVLVVLDNAASEEQIRPLLPGTATCAVLVSSRRRLTGIEGIRWTELEVFDRAESIQLLARIAGDERVARQPEDALEIVRLCGGLPLAVRVAGARLAARPAWRLAHLVKKLSAEHGRLDGLTSGDLEVRASLALSYEGLPAGCRRLFRLLGLFDMPHFPAWLAAAVLDCPLPCAISRLEAIVDAQLLTVTGPDAAGQTRHRFHDLVRLFARERAEIEETAQDRRRALTRGLGAWLAVAERMAVGVPGPCYATISGSAPRPPVDWVDGELMDIDALEWFGAERAPLIAAVDQACRHGMDELAFDLASRLEKYFDIRGMYADWAHLNMRVMAACHEAGNLRGEAVMLRGLVDVTTWVADSPASEAMNWANVNASRLLEMFVELGDRRGMSDAAVMCSWALTANGQYEEAVDRGMWALRLAEESEHQGGLVRAHIALAVTYGEKGRWERVLMHLNRALAVSRGMRNPRCEATVLQFLGVAQRERGELDASERHLERSLEISRRYGDKYAETLTMLALARLHQRRSDPRARTAAETALAFGREYTMGHHVADALGLLGEIELAQGRPADAIAWLEESVAMWRTRGWLSFLADALTTLGRAYAADGRTAAKAVFAEAREIYGRLRNDARVEELTRLVDGAGAVRGPRLTFTG